MNLSGNVVTEPKYRIEACSHGCIQLIALKIIVKCCLSSSYSICKVEIPGEIMWVDNAYHTVNIQPGKFLGLFEWKLLYSLQFIFT